jgi:crotonobetainyl-CoA:carnitine CoA-transferase CaiB-like acyl-CoA transferase
MTDVADPTAPLAGLRVLDLTRLFPGAFCTNLLADLGADILKVEAPGFGDGMRFIPEPFLAGHHALNRGKRSMTLNLKSPRAPEILRRLARDADVLIESGRPGSMEKLGAGFDDLRAENPGLIWCSITGFGPDGPNIDAPGHDLTYLGYAGLLAQLSEDDVPPVPSIGLTLQIAGSHAAFGIMAAVHGRHRTGVGSRVDANMVDSAIWMSAEQLTRAANSTVPGWGAAAARNNYECSDGRWITFTGSEPRAWARVVEVLDLPELADHKHGDDEPGATAKLAAAFKTKPRAHWLDHLGMAAGVGPVHALDDLLDDPQVTHHRGMPRLDGDGPSVVANPLRFDRATGDAGSHALSAPPELGEHTDAALAEVGYTPEEITALHEENAV